MFGKLGILSLVLLAAGACKAAGGGETPVPESDAGGIQAPAAPVAPVAPAGAPEPGPGSVRDLDDLERLLHARYERLRTLAAAFTQEKEMAVFKDTVVLEGSFFLAREGKVIWRVDRPVRYAMLIGSDSIRQWDEDSGEVTEIALSRNAGLEAVVQQLRTWFAGDYRSLRQEYDVDLASTGPFVLRFTPKGNSVMGRFVTGVEVQLDPEGLYASQIVMQETSGDRITTRIRDVVLDAPETARTWELRPRDP